jgi:hypothetical protein
MKLICKAFLLIDGLVLLLAISSGNGAPPETIASHTATVAGVKLDYLQAGHGPAG